MGSNRTILRLAAGALIIGLAITAYALRPAADVSEPGIGSTDTSSDVARPRLLDLGADKCVPCKLMAPILDELKVDYAAVFAVEFIDVWKHPDAAQPYKVKIIPTQIFFSPDGEELFRHEGFFGREDILAKWRELGIEIPEQGV